MTDDRAVAAVGESLKLSAFGLVGVSLWPAESPDEVRRAWLGLGAAGLVILTASAAEILDEERRAPGSPLTVVMPP